jgi:archaellum component FlaC
MDFFNNVGKKLGKTAKTITSKSEELVEITKINLSLGSEEDKVKKLLVEMGNELYVRFTNGESFDESLDGKCNQIKAIQENIETLKERVKNLKGHTSTDNSTDSTLSNSTDVSDNANFRLDSDNKSEEP